MKHQKSVEKRGEEENKNKKIKSKLKKNES